MAWSHDPYSLVYRNERGHIVTHWTLVEMGGWEAVEKAIEEYGPQSMIDGTFGYYSELEAQRMRRIIDPIIKRLCTEMLANH